MANQWYGIYNADTENFYPVYSTNRTMLEDLTKKMNRDKHLEPHCYTTKEVVDIGATIGIYSKQS